MADDINSSASFGQSKNDSEELPIIVAQRFLNIFRQLHIFSDERREAFNKMLLELPVLHIARLKFHRTADMLNRRCTVSHAFICHRTVIVPLSGTLGKWNRT